MMVRSEIDASYTLEGTFLENVENIKYLGVTITSNSKLNSHIINVCSKVNKTLGFLRRKLFSCPQRCERGSLQKSSETNP